MIRWLKMKSLYDYTNYRDYLRDLYLEKKEQQAGFSFRVLSRITGFSSPNFLKLVMEGKRNLSQVGARKICKGLKLEKNQTIFFKNLVLFNQAETTGEKQKFAEALLGVRAYRKAHPLSKAQFTYFANWYYIPIRELCSLRGFREDYPWMASQIVPPIQPQEAKRAVGELLKLGILKRNEKGRLELSALNITTGDEVTQSSVAHYHREMLQRASESIDRIQREHRDISGVAMGMSLSTAQKIKEKIQIFRSEIVDLVSKDDDPNTVYQLNIQLFPLAQVLDVKERK
jgi:uncharacterized protein (TIGR02147 family)